MQSLMSSYNKRDYDRILEMSHPMLLEKFDREFLISSFKTIFEENDEFSVTIKNVDPENFQVSEIFRTDDASSQYAFVSFPMDMDMKFKKQTFDEDSRKMMISMLEVQGMTAKFISDNTVNIKKLALTVALKDSSTANQWRYMNHDENNPMYVTVIPVEVIRKAKGYYSDLLLKEKENAN